MTQLKSLLIYVGLGLACFVFFTGTTRLDPLDLTLYAWVLGWPLLLFFKAALWMLAIFAVLMVIVGVIVWMES